MKKVSSRQLAMFLGLLFVLVRGVSTALSAEATSANCSNILPSSDPVQNFQTITACLNSPGHKVSLAAGVFFLSRSIDLPDAASISGSAFDSKIETTLTPAPSGRSKWGARGTSNFLGTYVVTANSHDVVTNLHLEGAGQLAASCCTSVVVINGQSSKLENLEIDNLEVRADKTVSSTAAAKVVGAYFLGPLAANSQMTGARIHDVDLGVIFAAGLTQASANSVSNSEFSRIGCDAITFAGFGEAVSNRIHSGGFDCKNGNPSIPGAAIYAAGNDAGAKIATNWIDDICGNGIDIVNSSNFVITGNTVNRVGEPLEGAYSFCVGGSPASFVNVSRFRVTGNTFHAIDSKPLGAFLRLFPVFAGQYANDFSVLPERDRQLIAVRLLVNSGQSTSNLFQNNTIVAECSRAASSLCVGTGLFVGSGVGAVGNIDGKEMQNIFIGNRVMGSNTGSIRCGSDFFGSQFACKKSLPNADCNDDDYFRDSKGFLPDGRNDGCQLDSPRP